MKPTNSVELGENPLIQAVANGRVGRGVVELLAQAGVDLAATDRNGNTAAGVAAWRGEGEALRALGALGVDLMRTNPLGFAPLHLAVSRGNLDAARVLVELGTSVNAVANDGSTPLLLAVANGESKILAWLCELRDASGGFDTVQPAAADPAAFPTAVAVSRYNSEYYCNIWQCIFHDRCGKGGGRYISVHFSVFGRGTLGPLQGAAESRLAIGGEGPSMDLILVNPCFVTETPNLISGTLTYAIPDVVGDPQSLTLWFEFGCGGYSFAKVLVSLPPPVQKPQQLLTVQSQLQVVDVEVVDHNGRTALVMAAEDGRADVVRLLVALGADPNAADRNGVTPAHAAALAVRRRNISTIQGAEICSALSDAKTI